MASEGAVLRVRECLAYCRRLSSPAHRCGIPVANSVIVTFQQMPSVFPKSFFSRGRCHPELRATTHDYLPIYNGMYLALRKEEVLPFVTTRMDLENSVLSKIS